jgi:alpha-L-fucosidase 2
VEHYASAATKLPQGNAYPIMKEVCEFWLAQLKALPDGRLVVPSGGPDHGPDEEGVSYSQELVWASSTTPYRGRRAWSGCCFPRRGRSGPRPLFTPRSAMGPLQE